MSFVSLAPIHRRRGRMNEPLLMNGHSRYSTIRTYLPIAIYVLFVSSYMSIGKYYVCAYMMARGHSSFYSILYVPNKSLLGERKL